MCSLKLVVATDNPQTIAIATRPHSAIRARNFKNLRTLTNVSILTTTVQRFDNRVMASTMSKAEKDLASLKSTVETVSSLIERLQSAVTASASATNTSTGDLNPLALASDAATLLKAHTTKISLMIINKPFTPTAISTILREVSSGPLTALVTAVQLCPADRFTSVLRKELQYRVSRVLKEYAALVGEIPLSGSILSEGQKNGTDVGGGRGSLASTGTVWEACDSLVEIGKMDIAGLMVRRAEQYRDTLKDALEELEEWGEEESDDEDEDSHSASNTNSDEDEGGEDIAHEQDAEDSPSGLSGNGNAVQSTQDALDELFGEEERHIPASDPHKIRPRLDRVLPQLKLLLLLYTALIKRRFRTLPPCTSLSTLPPLPPAVAASLAATIGLPSTPGRGSAIVALDTVAVFLGRIPDIVDELAGAFYRLDAEGIDRYIAEYEGLGRGVAGFCLRDWEGREDEFTVWGRRFVSVMKQDEEGKEEEEEEEGRAEKQ